MVLASKQPLEPEPSADGTTSEICERVVQAARRAAEAEDARRFFAMVAAALGRGAPTEVGTPVPGLGDEVGDANAARAGSALARELIRSIRDPWARDGIGRGLELFIRCVDETGRRCVAVLVAEYFGWREAPDRFFHRAGRLATSRSAADLLRVARITAGYARLPKPAVDELRLLAAVPGRAGLSAEAQLAVVAFAGDPPREQLRCSTDIPSLGSDAAVTALSAAGFGWLAEPGPAPVPVVGRPLLWFPSDLDSDLRRLHLIFSAAIA